MQSFFHLTSCGSGGTGRRTILRGWRRKAWGFESPLPHTYYEKPHEMWGFSLFTASCRDSERLSWEQSGAHGSPKQLTLYTDCEQIRSCLPPEYRATTAHIKRQ